MKRYGLLGLAAAVIAGLVVLVVMLRADSQATALRERPAPSEKPPATAIEPEREGRSLQPIVADEPATEDEAAREQAGDPTVRRYVRPDGIIVRDHRSGDREPDLTRAITRHPSQRQAIVPSTVLEIPQRSAANRG